MGLVVACVAFCLATVPVWTPPKPAPSAPVPSITPEQAAQVKQITPKQAAALKAWLGKLYEMGVRTDGDSLHVSKAAQRAVTDSAFRRIVYPETYDWGPIKPLMHDKQFKIAFWYLINLYETDAKNRGAALDVLSACDDAFDMEKATIAAFYTYGVFDPRVSTIVDGHPKVTRPDLLQQRLEVVKEINEKILSRRKHRQRADSTKVGPSPGGGK